MRDKAREFFEEARLLGAAKKFNGAASRLYYALYHAITAEFEAKGINQSDLTPKVDPNKPSYWLHEVVRNFSTLAGVSRRDAPVVREMYELRSRADYENRNVQSGDWLPLLSRVRVILSDLGIDV